MGGGEESKARPHLLNGKILPMLGFLTMPNFVQLNQLGLPGILGGGESSIATKDFGTKCTLNIPPIPPHQQYVPI